MITILRQFTQSLAFKVILAFLVVGLAMFGFKDVFNPLLNDEVIKAGHKSIKATDFRQAFDNYKAQQEQQNGGKPIPVEDAVKGGLHTQILNQMAQEAALQSQLIDSGIRPGPKVVTDSLKKYPRFFNKVTGQFDKDSYLAALRDAKLTEASFEGQMQDSIMVQHFGAAAISGIKSPKIMAALQTTNELQSRDISYFILDSTHLPPPAEPGEKDLVTFYNQIKPRLTRPEMRQFVVVSFAAGDFAATIPLDEAELKKVYDFRKDTLGKPEVRSFIQVTAPDAKAAASISQGLKAGQDPQSVARANKGTVIAYDAKPKSSVPDLPVANMAFTLPTGEVSGPIKGNLGYAVVKIGAITPGTETPFAAVHDQYAQEYRQQKALDKVYKLTEDFEKERSSGVSLLDAAKKLGARITPMPPMAADGRAINGDNFSQFPKIVKTAFDQPAGGESEIEDMGNGEYYAIKLLQILPSATPDLKTIRPQLIAAYKSQKADEALQTKVDQIVERLNGGENLAKAAAETKADVTSVAGLDYQTTPQKLKLGGDPKVQAQIGQALAGRIFSIKPKDSFSMRFSQTEAVIGVVNKAAPPPISKAVQTMPIATMMGARTLGNDLFQQSISAAGMLVRPKIYPQTALKALGVNPAPANDKAEPKKDIANP